jgi:hypothetical protein
MPFLKTLQQLQAREERNTFPVEVRPPFSCQTRMAQRNRAALREQESITAAALACRNVPAGTQRGDASGYTVLS